MPAFLKGKESEPMWKRAKVSEQIKQLLLSSKPMQEDDIVEAVGLYGAESPIQRGIDKAWVLVGVFKKQPSLSKYKAEMRDRFAVLTKEMNAILKELES